MRDVEDLNTHTEWKMPSNSLSDVVNVIGSPPKKD